MRARGGHVGVCAYGAVPESMRDRVGVHMRCGASLLGGPGRMLGTAWLQAHSLCNLPVLPAAHVTGGDGQGGTHAAKRWFAR